MTSPARPLPAFEASKVGLGKLLARLRRCHCPLSETTCVLRTCARSERRL
jgi:hypothetical protein